MLLGIEALVSRAVAGRFFAYPMAQRITSAALGAAVVFTPSEELKSKPEPKSVKALLFSLEQLHRDTARWKDKFHVVYKLSAKEKRTLFWKGEDSFAIRLSNLHVKERLQKPEGTWFLDVVPWYESLDQLCVEKDYLPYLYFGDPPSYFYWLYYDEQQGRVWL